MNHYESMNLTASFRNGIGVLTGTNIGSEKRCAALLPHGLLGDTGRKGQQWASRRTQG